MYFNESVKSDTISELFQLFSTIVREEAYLEDQKTILSENPTFYPQSAFSYLKNFKTFIAHSLTNPKDKAHSINIFDPAFLNQVPLEVSDVKYINYENFLEFLHFNDCNEIELQDLESFKSFYFASADRGIDYQSFLALFLPYSNKTVKRNAMKRKILYEVSNLQDINLSFQLQSLLAQILEDEILLFKRSEEIKIKLINEMHWDPIEAFNNLDFNSLSYLDFATLEVFFKNFGEKFSGKDFELLMKRINKDSEANHIYFEDFKKLVLPFRTYFTMPERLQTSNQSFTKSQVLMERVDHAINDDKYLILKSTMKGDSSQISAVNYGITSPSKIRQAIFHDTVLENNNNNIMYSMQSSKLPVKTRSNLSVANTLNASQKPIDNNSNQKSLYVSNNDNVLGKSMTYSRFPGNKIIQELYGEHKFSNMGNTHTPVKDFMFSSDQQPNKTQPIVNNFDNIVNPNTNFDNERLIKAKSHEKKIYTPIRQNPQLMLSLNSEFQVRNQQISSPLLYSRNKKPLFYSNTKEIQNNNSNFGNNFNHQAMKTLPEAPKINQSVNFLIKSASPIRQRRIFEGKEMNQSRNLNNSIINEKNPVLKSILKVSEPETSKRQHNDNNKNNNVSKPTPPIMI